MNPRPSGTISLSHVQRVAIAASTANMDFRRNAKLHLQESRGQEPVCPLMGTLQPRSASVLTVPYSGPPVIILPTPSPGRGRSLSFSLPLLFSLFLSPPSFPSPLGPTFVLPFSDSPLPRPTNQSWTSGLFCGVGSGQQSPTRRDTLHTVPGGRRGVVLQLQCLRLNLLVKKRMIEFVPLEDRGYFIPFSCLDKKKRLLPHLELWGADILCVLDFFG